eukprot:s701_g18.t1
MWQSLLLRKTARTTKKMRAMQVSGLIASKKKNSYAGLWHVPHSHLVILYKPGCSGSVHCTPVSQVPSPADGE